jgi:trk system potassium uptake protein TrkH
MINFKIVIKLLGVILLAMGIFMLLPLIVTIFTSTGEIYPFLFSSGLCIAIGLPFVVVKPEINKIGKREGYLIVALSWLVMSVAGMLPYLFEGVIDSIPSAFFESASGLTTTGASVFNDIESLPHGILFWRSFTQWIGGMGIIVLTVAIIPLLGVGGMNIFSAESPGPTKDKVHPKIKESAKRLWLIYTSLTLLLFFILHFFSGLSWFDSINHAFTTMSTGGFSTKNASIAHWNDPLVQYPIIIFMFLAGTNFTILYFLLKRKFSRVTQNEEFKVYLYGILIIAAFVSISVLANVDKGFEESIRMSLFQVVSIVTTTGFVSENYVSWSNGLTMGFFMLLFTGACAGSTSGGIKVVRHIVFFKNTILEFKRLMHPRALLRVKMNKELITGKVAAHVMVFLLVYLMIFCLGSILIMRLNGNVDKPFLTAIGSVATCLGNVGPGLGSVGPVNNFAHIPEGSKLVLSFLMIIGRLELFSVLIIFAPSFWKSN